MSPQRQEIHALMAKYAKTLNLKDSRVLDIGIAGDPKLPGAKSRSEKFTWFGEGNDFLTLDNDPAWEPDVLGDICDAPFPTADSNFGLDLVILSETLEHIWDFEAALRECNRILKTGGHLILTTPFMVDEHPTEATPDYWRFTKQAYEKLLSTNGFAIVDLYSSSLIKGALAKKN